jgi:hypothetical protein
MSEEEGVKGLVVDRRTDVTSSRGLKRRLPLRLSIRDSRQKKVDCRYTHTAMPPSQLKRLKTSLREQGVTGPQKSKKQKQQDRKGTTDSRVQRNAALQQIRDSFNPFEIKANNRPAKFQSLTAHPKKAAVLRPGVTRSMGEEAVSSVAFALRDQI